MRKQKQIIGISAEAEAVFRSIQQDGLCSEELLKPLSPDEQAFLVGELYVRTSRYGEIEANIPAEASQWWRRLAFCTGYLFTAPLQALQELSYLEPLCPNDAWALRLKVWRMHLLLLIGFEAEGKPLRDEILASGAVGMSPWQIEMQTLLSISYFSTSESKKAIEQHYQCFKLLEKSPEQYFTSLGAALAMRASLKICDAEAFEFFSQRLDDALLQTPDDRYRLRQLGYRSVILTQLGERELAQRYWLEGDKLFERVDLGSATVERVQYLALRLLAAALLGDQKSVERIYRKALAELTASNVYEVHLAEIEICYRLAPLANPVVRAQNLERSYKAATAAEVFFDNQIANAKIDSVKTCYLEARDFCVGLLEGKRKRAPRSGADRWRTLTLGVMDNYQNFGSFAEKIDYFRLLPKFIDELQKQSLTDKGLQTALERVVKFSPRLTERGFEIAFERKELSRISQVDILLKFANTLRNLYKEKEVSSRSRMLAETVQTVAHDFRRPFNLLRMALQAMNMCDDAEKIVALLENTLPTINKASEDVNRLLDDVRDASRPLQLNQDVVRPSVIVISALETLKSSNATANFKITTEYKDDTPIVVDEAKLVRALTNVLENATQASEGGQIWVKTASGSVEGREAISFTIGNGAYIAREDRRRLFEKYFSKGKALGTGLGLFIVKRIVEEHGGAVRCRSNRTRGTEFDLVIPVASSRNGSTSRNAPQP